MKNHVCLKGTSNSRSGNTDLLQGGKAKIRLMGLLCHLKKLLNKPKILIQAILFIYICALSIAVNAQTPIPERLTLTGTVVSSIDGKSIEGVKVSLAAATSGVLTDKNGNFTITTSRIKGSTLVAKLLGYDDKEISFTSKSEALKIVMNPINDPFRDRYPDFEPVKIGEKVPDIEFAIKNYPTSTAKISDFKGKLLIFDFWSTYCAPCIGSLSQMEKLQKQFGDKIQIILVNVRESEEEVESRLKRIKIPHQQIYTMPSIISNKALNQLFPHRFAGNYIWIDKEGILRLSSSQSYNNHEAKINDVLDNKAITFVMTDRVYSQDRRPLSEIINESPQKYAEYSSLFTSVDFNYFPLGGQVLNYPDTNINPNTIRNTYINNTVIELYNYALGESIKEEWKSKVYGPNLSGKYLDYFSISVGDSSSYDWRLIPNNERTDINMSKNMFCYEQIFPFNLNKELSREYMRRDLDRFFELKYKITVTVDELSVPCYLLKRININPVTKKVIKKKLRHLGKREYQTLVSLESVIGAFYRPTGQEPEGSTLPYVFDVNGVDKKEGIIMPVWRTGDSLDDFKLALEANGLEYIKGEKKIKMIVVRDNQ